MGLGSEGATAPPSAAAAWSTPTAAVRHLARTAQGEVVAASSADSPAGLMVEKVDEEGAGGVQCGREAERLVAFVRSLMERKSRRHRSQLSASVLRPALVAQFGRQERALIEGACATLQEGIERWVSERDRAVLAELQEAGEAAFTRVAVGVRREARGLLKEQRRAAANAVERVRRASTQVLPTTCSAPVSWQRPFHRHRPRCGGGPT
jgi:hypothetical protein